MAGADARFIGKSEKYIAAAIVSSGSSICDLLTSNGVDETVAKGVVKVFSEEISKEYKEKFAVEAKEELEGEFNRMVAMMPKSNVIELAEALVSITAVERKASSEQATVGGPVDVAFITKHEGFVWVKRKHYFDGSLNPRYFWRKFGGQMPTGETQ